MSSPKNSDYASINQGSKVVRKSIVPIIRMIERDINGTVTLLGTIKLSNMIPVPNNQLILYKPDEEVDSKYRDLIEKEIRYINRHSPEIIKKAGVLYKQKIEGRQINYLSSTLDFRLLESAHDKYIAE